MDDSHYSELRTLALKEGLSVLVDQNGKTWIGDTASLETLSAFSERMADLGPQRERKAILEGFKAFLEDQGYAPSSIHVYKHSVSSILAETDRLKAAKKDVLHELALFLSSKSAEVNYRTSWKRYQAYMEEVHDVVIQPLPRQCWPAAVCAEAALFVLNLRKLEHKTVMEAGHIAASLKKTGATRTPEGWKITRGSFLYMLKLPEHDGEYLFPPTPRGRKASASFLLSQARTAPGWEARGRIKQGV